LLQFTVGLRVVVGGVSDGKIVVPVSDGIVSVGVGVVADGMQLRNWPTGQVGWSTDDVVALGLVGVGVVGVGVGEYWLRQPVAPTFEPGVTLGIAVGPPDTEAPLLRQDSV
jgi:hypothetical protein